MLHASTKKLIDKLGEMTRKRRIGWAETEDGRLAYQTEGYSVILGGEPQSMQLLSREGKLLEEVSADEIAESRNDDGTPYQQAFSEMYREAARQARGTETAIDTVLAGLDLDGDGIPDLPAEPVEETSDADEGVTEDNVDESWQGQVAPADTAPSFQGDTGNEYTPEYTPPATAFSPQEPETEIAGQSSASQDAAETPAQDNTPAPSAFTSNPVDHGGAAFGTQDAFNSAPNPSETETAPLTQNDSGAQQYEPVETPFSSEPASATGQTPADPVGEPASPAWGDNTPAQQPPSASQIWGQQPAATEPAPIPDREEPTTADAPSYSEQPQITPEQTSSPVGDPFSPPVSEATEPAASGFDQTDYGADQPLAGSAGSTPEPVASDPTEPENTASGQSGFYTQEAPNNTMGGLQAPVAGPGGEGSYGQTSEAPQPSAAPFAQPQEPAPQPVAQPGFQPTPAPTGSDQPPQAQPAQPPAYTQTPLSQPAQPSATPPGDGHQGETQRPGQAQSDITPDEDEEGSPPPKPITRFNPWN